MVAANMLNSTNAPFYVSPSFASPEQFSSGINPKVTKMANISRAKRIIEARAVGPEAATSTEQTVAAELLSESTIVRDATARASAHPDYRDLSPFASTEAFAKALQAAMTAFAVKMGVKAPKPGKYDLLFATPTLFREVWLARQAIDETGIPYDFYCANAIEYYWLALDNDRTPRPSKLTAADVSGYVMQQWFGRNVSDAASKPAEAVMGLPASNEQAAQVG
jgi:hypothetical protein